MSISTRLGSIVEGLCFILLVAGFVVIQVLIGGTRMVFSLPSYALVGGVGLLSVFALRRAKPTPSQVCLTATAIFFTYILVRAWFSPVPYIARADIHSVLGGLIVYFFTACLFTGARQRLFFLVILLALALGHTA